MLTIASPKAHLVEIDIRARWIQSTIQTARTARKSKEQGAPVAIVYSIPQSLSLSKRIQDAGQHFVRQAQRAGMIRARRLIPERAFCAPIGFPTPLYTHN